MKLKLFFLLYLGLISALEEIKLEHEEASMISAASQIIRKFYDKRLERVNVTFFKNHGEHLSDTINEILRQSETPLYLQEIYGNKNERIKLNNSILFMNSSETFDKSIKNLVIFKTFPTKLNVLFFIDKLNEKSYKRLKIPKTKFYDIPMLFHHSVFLVRFRNETDSIRLMTRT